MIYVIPAESTALLVNIVITDVIFKNNRQVHFLKVKSKTEILWKQTIYILVKHIIISQNKHHNSDSLISLSNGILSFQIKNVFAHNSMFDNLIKLHIAAVLFKGDNKFTSNFARQILYASSSSYVVIRENTIVNISNNVVYTVFKQTHT